MRKNNKVHKLIGQLLIISILARELLKAYEIEVIKDMENKDRFLFVKRRKI